MTETPTFKPSDVDLNGSFPPLIDTLGQTELEMAASMLVRACAVRGDSWQPISPQQLGIVILDDVAAQREPFFSLKPNPFFNPDFHGLAKKGFARFTASGAGAPIELTPEGIERLRKWARKPAGLQP